MDKTKYYVLKKKAVPEVLLKVVEKGQTVTMVIQMDDTPGLLAELLREAAKYRANILTIHQSIPINGIATLTLSIEILSTTGNISEMVDEMEENEGVHYLKIVGRE